jgi:glycerol 2-dehydrogenase (NAD+) (EC 1.1.1.6)
VRRRCQARPQKGRISLAVERLIECNILLSGVGFESGGLALAHAIANGLTILPECKAMHGEAVAFGLVVQLRLERAPELDQVLEFCQRVGLPTTLAELGLGEISDADLQSVANAVFRNERNMANEQAKGDQTKARAAHVRGIVWRLIDLVQSRRR